MIAYAKEYKVITSANRIQEVPECCPFVTLTNKQFKSAVDSAGIGIINLDAEDTIEYLANWVDKDVRIKPDTRPTKVYCKALLEDGWYGLINPLIKVGDPAYLTNNQKRHGGIVKEIDDYVSVRVGDMYACQR